MNSNPIELTQVASPATRLLHLFTRRRLKAALWFVLALLVLALLVYLEFQSSILQSWIFTRTNERGHYELGDGKSPSIAFPGPAPFDDRRGYSKLPVFQSRLESQGYRVSQQVRQSETMVNLI